MKIRKGFVSNSSSSSFCIWGIRLESVLPLEIIKDKELKEKFLKAAEDETDDLYYLYVAAELGYTVEYDNDGDLVWIGREWDTIKDDETGKEFKEATGKGLNKLFNIPKEVGFETHKEITTG